MALLLTQFLYRLSFGMAAAMAITPPKQVTSGYYRNNLYVLLGLNALAAIVAWGGATAASIGAFPRAPATLAAVLCYFGAACWLYEKPRAGIAALIAVSIVSLYGALATTPVPAAADAVIPFAEKGLLAYAGVVTSGLLLGTTMAAMLLGHWYLNAPGMRIQPLFRLTTAMGVALFAQTIVSGIGLTVVFLGDVFATGNGNGLGTAQQFMLALRWLAGIFGTAGLIWMTVVTLEIPNTQAATGMLYVAVITTFLGELIGQLLSSGSLYPL